VAAAPFDPFNRYRGGFPGRLIDYSFAPVTSIGRKVGGYRPEFLFDCQHSLPKFFEKYKQRDGGNNITRVRSGAVFRGRYERFGIFSATGIEQWVLGRAVFPAEGVGA
jgi:hypothetical protein